MTEHGSRSACSPADWDEALGPDLLALLKKQNLQLKSVERLVHLDAPAHLTDTFRLVSTAGNSFKARNALNEARAERIDYFLARLGKLAFPAVEARCGRSILLQWISGEQLTHDSACAQLEAAGRLLGKLHAQPIPPDCPYAAPADTAQAGARIEQSLLKLKSADLLGRDTADVILQVASDNQPARASSCIIHTDLCPDNLVLDAEGRLRSIDNESLQIGFSDLDLARSWYRWPLESNSGEAFLSGYTHHADPAAFRKHFAFWFTAVLLESIVYRLESPSGAWNTPLTRLNNFAREPESELPDD